MNNEFLYRVERLEKELSFLLQELKNNKMLNKNISKANTPSANILSLYGLWEGKTANLIKEIYARRKKSGRTERLSF